MNGHLAGQALVSGGIQALQEVSLFGAGLAAMQQPRRDLNTAGTTGTRAAAEGDVGAGGIGDALERCPGWGFNQQVLQTEVDLH